MSKAATDIKINGFEPTTAMMKKAQLYRFDKISKNEQIYAYSFNTAQTFKYC